MHARTHTHQDGQLQRPHSSSPLSLAAVIEAVILQLPRSQPTLPTWGLANPSYGCICFPVLLLFACVPARSKLSSWSQSSPSMLSGRAVGLLLPSHSIPIHLSSRSRNQHDVLAPLHCCVVLYREIAAWVGNIVRTKTSEAASSI